MSAAAPIVVLVGPTASGKSELAVELAEAVGGEIVSADAFAVYRGLDIGTAKPPVELRARVRHHLIDIADPRERYSAGMFMRDADAAIAEVRRGGKLPIIAGGTLFYVRALLYGLFPERGTHPELRRYLESCWGADRRRVRRWLELVDGASAARLAPADRQRTLRALEVTLAAGRPMSAQWAEHPLGEPRHRALTMGVAPPRPELHARIASRVARMFASGLLEEVRGLLAAGVSADAHALKAIGYRECCQVLAGTMTVEQAQARTVAATRQLARRQLTWLRGESAVWLRGTGAAALREAIANVEAHCGTGTGSAQG